MEGETVRRASGTRGQYSRSVREEGGTVARPLPHLPHTPYSHTRHLNITTHNYMLHTPTSAIHTDTARGGKHVVLLSSLPNRWRKVKRALVEMERASDVWTTLDKVATLTPLGKRRANPVADGLRVYYNSRSSSANQQSLLTTLQAVALFARGVDARLQGGRLPVLTCGQAAVVSVNRQLAAGLLAHIFLCLTRGRDACSMARVLESMDMRLNSEKVKCMLSYFTRLQENHMLCYSHLHDMNITLERVSLSEQLTLSWSQLRSSTKSLCKLTFSSDVLIEDTSTDYVKVIFMNSRRVRGKALTATKKFGQQEMMCMIYPELLLTDMLMESLADNEALIISGFERYSTYEGVDCQFRFTGRYNDTCASDNVAVAMDAQYCVDNKQRQYQRMHVLRDINKAYAGFSRFSATKHSSSNSSRTILPQRIATGNWGCGKSLGGDPQLKAIVQWVAASEAGCEEVMYCSRGDTKVHTLAANIHQLSYVYKTVGDLVQMLERCEQQVISSFLSQQMTKLTYQQRHLSSASRRLHVTTTSRVDRCSIS